MHFGIRNQRPYSAVVSGVVLYVDDPFSLSRIQDKDCGIDIGRTVLVLTYGFLQKERRNEKGLE